MAIGSPSEGLFPGSPNILYLCVMNIKAILFDMDGVLALTEPMHYEAWLNVIHEIDRELVLPEKDIVGVTDSSIAQNIIDSTGTSRTVDDLLELKKKNYLALAARGVPETPGRDKFLETYSRRAMMAVVSSSTREEIEQTLRAGNIIHYFAFFIGYEDVELHKPHPEPYLRAIRQCGFSPEQILIVEDSPAGVEAALKTNAHVVGFNTSHLLDGMDQIPVFNDYGEISQWLEAKNRTHA